MAVLTLIVGLNIAGGLGMIVGGDQPADPLHFLYAVLAIAAVPVINSFSRRMPRRREAVVTALGAVIAAVVVIRLFQTG